MVEDMQIFAVSVQKEQGRGIFAAGYFAMKQCIVRWDAQRMIFLIVFVTCCRLYHNYFTRVIDKLKKMELLERFGGNKGGHWQIKPAGSQKLGKFKTPK